ncbi:MAG: hypothetical protein AB7F74_16880 [Parvibaculaceae bacterium]
MSQKAAASPMNNQPLDFVGYGPKPPSMTWPGGAKVAVNLALDYEEGSEYSWAENGHNDNWGEYNIPVSASVRDLGTETHFEYCGRVAPGAVVRPLSDSHHGLGLRRGARAQPRRRRMDECAWPRPTGHCLRWREYSTVPREQEERELYEAMALYESFEQRG